MPEHLPFLLFFYCTGAVISMLVALFMAYFFVFEMLIVGTIHSISFNIWLFRTAKIRSGLSFSWRRDTLKALGLFFKHMLEFTGYRTGASKYRDHKTDSYWEGFGSHHIGKLRDQTNYGRRSTDNADP